MKVAPFAFYDESYDEFFLELADSLKEKANNLDIDIAVYSVEELG